MELAFVDSEELLEQVDSVQSSAGVVVHVRDSFSSNHMMEAVAVKSTETFHKTMIEACLLDSSDVTRRTSQALSESSQVIYSKLLARPFYYKVVQQRGVIPQLDECIVTFMENAQMYAVHLQPNFVHYVAERCTIPDGASLHICVRNPMNDPYLTEIYQKFQKGVDREKLLLIILPLLHAFNACVTSPTRVRARTAKNLQFITTLSDFEMLLLQMTAGFICKLTFV